ncbi:MAG: hypothetical protein EAY75_12400 [Bacteroidetes bacterium]|nr:MAG: hypothetical protein EAY75_12400 [Bacteroidota bacterium]
MANNFIWLHVFMPTGIQTWPQLVIACYLLAICCGKVILFFTESAGTKKAARCGAAKLIQNN